MQVVQGTGKVKLMYFCAAQMEATKVWGEENKRWKLFISHFYDCELCWGSGMTAQQLDACHAGYMQHYEFAYCRFHR